MTAPLKRIERTAARITARLDGRALKRVEAWLDDKGRFSSEDIEAVLALAKEAAELKRRIKLARRLLSPLGKRYGNPVDVPRWAIDRALDLRKPLPKRGRR
jgi:hypothetical protein